MNIAEFLSGQHAIVLFFILLVFLAIGDFFSLKTKAFLPSVFIFSLLTLVTAWLGIIPPETFSLIGVVAPFTGIVSLLTVANMGTSMDTEDIVKNWRVVIIGLAAIVGTAIMILLIGTPIFGWETSVISSPVVAGGLVASLEMQEAARASGNESLAIIAALILAFQSFPGFILTPILLKNAMKKDLKLNGNVISSGGSLSTEVKNKCKIPEKYLSTATLIGMVALIGVLAVYSSKLTRMFMGNFAISQSVFALIYGIIFSAVGLVPKAALKKASSNGIILILTIFNAFGVLTKTTFQEVAQVAFPVLGTIVLGIVGIFAACIIVSKIFKMDWQLSVALGLNCLLGFPLNYQLTLEAINAVTDDPKVAKQLEDKYMPMMLVAGFVTITIGSVILAGIMRNFI